MHPREDSWNSGTDGSAVSSWEFAYANSEDRSWEVFEDWFDVEFLGAPWDIVAEPLHSTPPPRGERDWD